jgi:hypothetical protein
MERPKGFEILEFIELPENSQFASFFKLVQGYYDYYGLQTLFNLMKLLNLFKEWISDMDTDSITTRAHKRLFDNLNKEGYNSIDTYIILDILLMNFGSIKFTKLVEEDRRFVLEALRDESEKLASLIPYLPLKEMVELVEKIDDKPYQVKIEILYIYLLQFHRGVKNNPENRNYFEQLILLTIKNLKEKAGENYLKCKAETLLERTINFIPEGVNKTIDSVESKDIAKDEEGQKLPQSTVPKPPAFEPNEKMFVKDVAKVLHCHESQVRRLIQRKINPLKPYRDSPRGMMYFFYPEVVDWMKSHRQEGLLDEAGEVFQRKHKAVGKKRRPKL